MFAWTGDFDLPEAIRYRWHGVLDVIDPTPEGSRRGTALGLVLVVAAFALLVIVGLLSAQPPVTP